MNDSAEWIKRALSALALASLEEENIEVQYEDRCFQLQQAAEKALKGILVYRNVEFPHTHDLTKLLRLIEPMLHIPDEIKDVVRLNHYAVQTRYSDDFEAVDKDEYLKAKYLTSRCVAWAESVMKEEN